MAEFAAQQLQLDLSLEHEFEHEDEGAFGALVAANHKWLGHYARMHATFSVEHTLLERNSIWMNAYFQKNRMITSPWSRQAKALIKKHQETVLERLRCVPPLHSESEFSTQSAEPIAALMFAASVDRCPEAQIENLMSEALDLLECNALRTTANRSGFAGCVFRFLTQYTEEQKRILCLQLLVLLAEDDADAVVRACQVAAQGQHWQPNMFIYTLQKRHSDSDVICDLVTQLLGFFSERMPITSPIQLDSPRSLFASRDGARQEECFAINDDDRRREDSGLSPHRRSHTLPSLGSPKAGSRSPTRALHSPTTTMSSLYMEAPSPYAPHMRLPMTRPPTSPLEQSRRSRIFSTPKLAAVEGDKQRRCRTPNARDFGRPNHFQLAALDAEGSIDDSDAQSHTLRSLDPLDGSPPKSPRGDSPKKLSEKYSWNPECINSVSGFEWWWRSLPQNHANLEPTQKLKMVTKAAVRLHTKGDWQRAIELYLLSLSMEINEEVEFRLRINLACAYEAAQELSSSIKAFRAALKLNPDDPYARFKLGEVLGATGEFAEARKLFEAVLSVYPQAADALAKLQQVEYLRLQEEEAKGAATATAKLRRSPSKKKRTQRNSEQEEQKPEPAAGALAQPMAPSSPPTSSPASRRASEKLKSASAKASPREIESPSVACAAESNDFTTGDSPVPPASAGESDTLGDAVGCHVSSESDVNARAETLEAIAPRSLAEDSDASTFVASDPSATPSLVPVHCDAHKHEGEPVFSIRNLAETSADQWMQEGAQRVAVTVKDANDPNAPADALASEEEARAHTATQGPRSADVEEQAASLSDADRSAPAQQETAAEAASAGEATSGRDDDSPGGALPAEAACEPAVDGYTALSPRVDVKREKARREQILLREKSRIFARKHIHCLRSLRELAIRARKHHTARCEAREFLAELASYARRRISPAEANADGDARVVVSEAAASRGGEQEEHAEESSASDAKPVHTADFLSEVAHKVYAAAVSAAVESIVGRSGELTVGQLQSLARNYASTCDGVPSTLLQVCVRATTSPSSSEAEPQ